RRSAAPRLAQCARPARYRRTAATVRRSRTRWRFAGHPTVQLPWTALASPNNEGSHRCLAARRDQFLPYGHRVSAGSAGRQAGQVPATRKPSGSVTVTPTRSRYGLALRTGLAPQRATRVSTVPRVAQVEHEELLHVWIRRLGVAGCGEV